MSNRFQVSAFFGVDQLKENKLDEVKKKTIKEIKDLEEQLNPKEAKDYNKISKTNSDTLKTK